MNTKRLWLYKIITAWMPETSCFGIKAALLRWAGAKIGKSVRISTSATFLGAGELIVGNDVWIGAKTFFSAANGGVIEIGSCVDIAQGAMFFTGSHVLDPDGQHIAGRGNASPIKIGDGCWIGARATIMPGIVLAEKTVVAAGAVVTKDACTPKTLFAGVPAKCCKRY